MVEKLAVLSAGSSTGAEGQGPHFSSECGRVPRVKSPRERTRQEPYRHS